MTVTVAELNARINTAFAEQQLIESKIQKLFIEVGSISEAIARVEGNLEAEIQDLRARHLQTRKKRIEKETSLRLRLPELLDLRDALAGIARGTTAPDQDTKLFQMFGHLDRDQARTIALGICTMISALINELTE